MKKNDLKELRNKSIKELEETLKKLKIEVLNLKIDQAVKKLKNPHLIKTKKRNIAVIETLISEKKLMEEK